VTTTVIMPQLGESVVEGTVGKWLKQPGDAIAKFEPLLTVNTDKVDTEIPSPDAGVLLKILVNEGATVSVGTPLAVIGQPGEEVSPASSLSGHGATAEPEPAKPTAQASGERVSPVVARMAAEHKIDLSRVKGTGLGGRVTKQDLLAYLEVRHKEPERQKAEEAALAPWEQPGTGELFRPTEELMASATQASPPSARAETSQTGEDEEIVELTPMRKAIAEHMMRSMQSVPQVTTVMEVDMSRVVQYREAHRAEYEREGLKLTYTPFFVQAIIAGIQKVPWANSSWREGKIILKKRIHIGIAVALEEGLIVPVLRDADRLSLRGLARAVNDLSERARSKRLKPDEVHGATFTLTNHGVAGSLFATPLINLPNAAILGAGAIVKRPIVINDAIAIRPMCYLSLTFDHRIMDGAAGDAFLAAVKARLENWET
jgi:2-oxoisovalerate dehydrogenase E2 component (dihydrolipoyl transacylase)